MEPQMNSRKFGRLSRRELLKLTPVLALGAFAIPKVQNRLLAAGLGFLSLIHISTWPWKTLPSLLPHRY